ncbi:hypothetical protein [Spirosoma pollinicola]|uniref:Outer membrane protein beta-barrel domain-containing protein n=1 Tax=Spirosoma pollinicola TaxID=2057025 RepID=A0A2K8Z0T9_9BACT|nr:hypothetical protein [Spirosoma pollinicola]AUD03481.1 hypothetical protein CWM47_17580 [Spirosoma pollinicola]
MKTIALLLPVWLLLGTYASWGQSRFSVSINLAPTFSHSNSKSVIPPTNNPAVPIATATEVLIQSHSLGYSVGLMGHYALTTKWSLSTGVWATQTQSSQGKLILNGDAIALSYSNKHPFHYAYRVPIFVNYQSSTNRISPYFSVGSSADFRSTSYAYINGQEIPIKLGKPVAISPLLVGAGVIGQLKRQLTLVVQPMLEYDLQAHPTYTYYHTYQLSLQTQLRYRF